MAELGEDPVPLKETFVVRRDNMVEAAEWVLNTAAHYEVPEDKLAVAFTADRLEIREQGAWAHSRQQARPGDVLMYGEHTGFVVRPGEVAGMMAGEGASASARWEQRMAGVGEDGFLAGLPRDHVRTPTEEAQLTAAIAAHPAGSGRGLTSPMPPGLGMEGANVTALRGGARLS